MFDLGWCPGRWGWWCCSGLCHHVDSEVSTRVSEKLKPYIFRAEVSSTHEATRCRNPFLYAGKTYRNFFLFSISSLMMEAVRTSETSVDNHFTRQYNPEDTSEHLFTLLCNFCALHKVPKMLYCTWRCFKIHKILSLSSFQQINWTSKKWQLPLLLRHVVP
jgi:hypothetical protein